MIGVGDPRVGAVLEELHAAARREMPRLLVHYLPKLGRMLRGRSLDWSGDLSFYDDKLIPLERAQGEMLHVLAIAAQARCVVELGTGFGVGALYLSAAMRETGGRYIGTEIVPAKAEAAREHLSQAGLSDWAELRIGDALATLGADLPERIDLLVLDGWPPAALPVLHLLEPRMPRGALLVADNVRTFRADYADLVDYVHRGDWHATTQPQKAGTLIAAKASQQQMDRAEQPALR